MIFRYDFLRVYDGDSVFATEIGVLTGLQLDPVMSSGPDIYLNFLSDQSEQTAGFRIQYERSKNEFLNMFS